MHQGSAQMQGDALCLTAAQLIEYTGYKLATRQVRELTYMGVPYRLRSNGTPAVLLDDVRLTPTAPTVRNVGPDLSQI